jgi:hypothetical protein
MSRFHEGEIEVQRRHGVRDDADRVGQIVATQIPDSLRPLLARQRLAVAATLDARNRPWASLLTGPEGFIEAVDEELLRLDVHLRPDDPLVACSKARSAGRSGGPRRSTPISVPWSKGPTRSFSPPGIPEAAPTLRIAAGAVASSGLRMNGPWSSHRKRPHRLAAGHGRASRDRRGDRHAARKRDALGARRALARQPLSAISCLPAGGSVAVTGTRLRASEEVAARRACRGGRYEQTHRVQRRRERLRLYG